MRKMKASPENRRKPRYTLRVNDTFASRASGERTGSFYLTEFMRDRDRVLMCQAFRRLAGKAQVYIAGVDDHRRTRLTHTLEVSQLARSIAESLRLDANLAEAIALAHDLGHTPYGHAGERVLHELMTPQMGHALGERCPLELKRYEDGLPRELEPFLGFKHNLQSIVVAMELEKSQGEYGLDLTNYTLHGIQAHSRSAYKPGQVPNHDCLGYYDEYLRRGCTLESGEWAWSFEGLLVAMADEIAQYHHDVEDALLGGLISPEEIVKIMVDCFGPHLNLGRLSRAERHLLENPREYDEAKFNALVSEMLVDLLVAKLTEAAAYHLNRLTIDEGRGPVTNDTAQLYRLSHSPDEAEVALIFSFCHSEAEKKDPDSFAGRVERFAKEVSQRVHTSHDIQTADAKGQYIIRKIFQSYYHTPQQLPDRCVYELLATCNRLHKRPEYAERFHAPKLIAGTEEELRRTARTEGVGSIRRRFSKLLEDRSKTTEVEELVLMRVICNHIAGMTDAYALKTYRELYE